MSTGSIPQAAKIVGVNRSTAWRISKTPEFQDELRHLMAEQARVARYRLLEHQTLAWTAIVELLNSSDERIRARVAMWVAGRGLAEAHISDREPEPTELQRELQALEQALFPAATTDGVGASGD
jgi:hypothetical protein